VLWLGVFSCSTPGNFASQPKLLAGHCIEVVAVRIQLKVKWAGVKKKNVLNAIARNRATTPKQLSS
jgi:hypothetical protein